MMLAEFLEAHRDEILADCRARVSERTAPRPTAAELEHGLPLFFAQMIERLRAKRSDGSARAAVGRSAALHGSELLREGFLVADVVHDYGDLCQATMSLAVRSGAAVSAEDYRIFNECSDEAIAEAVAEYQRLREHSRSMSEVQRSGEFTHEIRNVLNAATLSFQSIQRGSAKIDGEMGATLGRCLRRMRDLVERSIAGVRMESGVYEPQSIRLAELMEELGITGALYAKESGKALTLPTVDYSLFVRCDRLLVASAVANLLQNAFKFTRPGGMVTMRAFADAPSVCIEVEDECGGLPPGASERLFLPFAQEGSDRSGLGLGLTISRRAIEACGGLIQVRDLPGRGCVFVASLPSFAPPDSQEPLASP